MGVPLFARGNVAGLFSLSKREADYFNEEHVKLAEAMSSQASVAVENAVLFEQMQASTARMQSLSRRLVEAQESERRSIARELHDEAGQALASLRFGLRLLEREIDEGGSVTGRVAELDADGPMPSSTACIVWPRTCARRASTTSGSRRRCASTRGRRRPSSASRCVSRRAASPASVSRRRWRRRSTAWSRRR